MRRRNLIRATCVCFLSPCAIVVISQYDEGSPQFEQAASEGVDELRQKIRSHPDYAAKTFPEFDGFGPGGGYVVREPHVRDYAIDLLVSPCGVNDTVGGSFTELGYDCCSGVYGGGEYGILRPEAAAARGPSVRARVPAGPDEILANVDLRDERGDPLRPDTSRRADDGTEIDRRCVGRRDPHARCAGRGRREVASPLAPPCSDHNRTVDALLGCADAGGERAGTCLQIAYTQTTFVHVCGGEFADDGDCGTFVEVHRPNGSPYDDEKTILASTKIQSHMSSGMTTITVPTTYKADPRRILCDYRESRIRVGTLIKINDNVRTCCCPDTYNWQRKTGSFFCPKNVGTGRDGAANGPHAKSAVTPTELAAQDKKIEEYPHCPYSHEKSPDVLMCSKLIAPVADKDAWRGRPAPPRYYTVECNANDDLLGHYTGGACPHGPVFQACAAPGPDGACDRDDSAWSFAGDVGTVTRVSSGGGVDVSFNGGRTSYGFAPYEVEAVDTGNTYELWFVLRTRHGSRVVQKKKPFRVVAPRCTYDTVNDQYFPFAQLDDEDNVLESFAMYDGVL